MHDVHSSEIHDDYILNYSNKAATKFVKLFCYERNLTLHMWGMGIINFYEHKGVRLQVKQETYDSWVECTTSFVLFR